MQSRTLITIGMQPTLFWASATALGVMLLVGAFIAPAIGLGLYMTSGVWVALATDFADGLFYRPLVSDFGYGGTRYFPLHFVLHGALIQLFDKPVTAAYIISYGSGVLLLLGLYQCMRRLEVPTRFAAPSAVLSLSALCAHACLYQLRPDMLAAAFNVWGILFCIRPGRSTRRSIAAAAIFFVLAFLTKFTTVFGVAAAVGFWVIDGRRRDAAMLAGAWGVLSAAALVVVHVASEGRALESFLACAAGGTTLQTLLQGPFRFFYTTRIDLPFLILFLVAFVLWTQRLRERRYDLLSIFFGLTFGATIVIASDRGAGINHFIDMQAASALLVAVHVAEGTRNRIAKFALPLSGLLGALLLVSGAIGLSTYYAESRYAQQSRIITLTGQSESPLLSDDPWIPILEGETPYILDNYSLRTIGANNPAIADDLFEKLDRRFFRAAVLFYGKQAPRGPNRNVNIEAVARSRYYSWMLYPEGFYDRLTQNYAPREFIGDYLVLLPR